MKKKNAQQLSLFDDLLNQTDAKSNETFNETLSKTSSKKVNKTLSKTPQKSSNKTLNETPKKISKETPYETRLAEHYRNETEKAYANIRRAIRQAEEAFKTATMELPHEGKRSESEERIYRRELAKHAKAAVRQIEKDNHLHVFLFRSTTGSWWKIGGNSIAIHRMMIGTYLDREIHINLDHDNFATFKSGVICLQDEYRMEKDVIFSGAPLTLDRTIDYGVFEGFIQAYRLKKPLEEREIRQFKSADTEIMKSINSSIFATAPDVEINNYMISALRECYLVERQIDGGVRKMVGHRLIDALFDMRRAYYDVANVPRKRPERYDAMRRIDELTGNAMIMLANYAELGVVNRSAVVRASLGLAKTREVVRQKINTYERKHAIASRLNDLRDDEAEKRAEEVTEKVAGKESGANN